MRHTGEMPTTAGTHPAIPQYSADLFVNREKEIKFVAQKAQALALGEVVRERTIVFWGYKGTGKTWLLRRITEKLKEMPGVKPLYIDLDLYTGQSSEEAIENLLVRVAQDIWEPDSKQAFLYRRATEMPFSTLTAWLTSDLRDLLREQSLALLLDHVYEADWNFLELLQERILAWAALQPCVLIVMAGRGRAYPWKTPELRLYTEEYHLIPFDEDLTAQQLEKQKPDAVPRTPEIHEMSQGYPLGNYLLAARPTVTEAMQETLDGLLDRAPAEERSWLEALCVLRTFDEDRIPAVLAAYFDDPLIRKWRYPQVRQVRDRLLITPLVRWKEEAGGWVVDEAVRPMLEKYLQETKPEVWRRLHCAAYRLYKKWEQQYPDEQERWRDEANHHAQCLRDAGHDPEECLKNLGQG